MGKEEGTSEGRVEGNVGKVVELMEKYPLELVADPMGKKSVIWTWEEIFSEKKVEENGLMESQKDQTLPKVSKKVRMETMDL